MDFVTLLRLDESIGVWSLADVAQSFWSTIGFMGSWVEKDLMVKILEFPYYKKNKKIKILEFLSSFSSAENPNPDG